MEKLFVLCGIFVLATTANALTVRDPCSPAPAIVEEVVKDCQSKYFDDATFKTFLTNPASDAEGLKRFQECSFTKLGWIKNGKLSTEAIEEFFNTHVINKESAKNINEHLQQAAEEANKADNALDVAHKFFKTVLEKEQEKSFINREFC